MCYDVFVFHVLKYTVLKYPRKKKICCVLVLTVDEPIWTGYKGLFSWMARHQKQLSSYHNEVKTRKRNILAIPVTGIWTSSAESTYTLYTPFIR